MHAKIEAHGRLVQSWEVPECANPAFKGCLEANAAALDLNLLESVRVSESDDPAYEGVLEVDEIDLLAEARPIVEAIKNGLRRRLSNPLEEGERISFR